LYDTHNTVKRTQHHVVQYRTTRAEPVPKGFLTMALSSSLSSLLLLLSFWLLLSSVDYAESLQNDYSVLLSNPKPSLQRHIFSRNLMPASKNHYERHRSAGIKTALFAKNKQSDGDVLTLIHSHHLLDHKPDNMILKGGKFKLRGVACLGRPGVALCLGPQAAIDKFLQKLKSSMPQKKILPLP
jgi:hypothetical protein